MSNILVALAAAVLIPTLSAVWSRRRKGQAEAAKSLVFGLLILAAAIVCFYFALSLAAASESELVNTFFVLIRITLFAAGVFGLMAGAAITWESKKD